MKVLTILTILTIGSGCESTPPYAPNCSPEGPSLEPISLEEQWDIMGISPDLLGKIASNDLKLKNHIKLLEELAAAHNEQYGVKCDEEG